MKFNEFKYERIPYEEIKTKIDKQLDELRNAKDKETFKKAFDDFNAYRDELSTLMTLVSIRSSINTKDEFYQKEKEYWNETYSNIALSYNEFYKIMLEREAEFDLGISHVFYDLARNALKAYDERIVEESIKESNLSIEFSKLVGSAKIELDGEIHNLSTLSTKLNSLDRDTRKRAFEALINFFETNEAEYDRIYDEMVKLRDAMAKKLGYKDYCELGYINMSRLDYDKEMVANFRKQIVEEVVPLVSKLNKAKRERLGLSDYKEYDKAIMFKTGNPKPKGNEQELVAIAAKMYKEMSKETDEFFTTMLKHDLFDLSAREGKMTGGYCTELPSYKLPFIFANFTGLKHDVDVLTHEAGHAFQSYSTIKNTNIPEFYFPTYESCEIHSMTMEFLAYPWIKEFFKEDSEKYFYSHLSSAIEFLPYGCLIDHFQHEVYENPEMTPRERKACFRRLQKIYTPDTDYSDYPFLERGGFFFRQNHIFQSPFYYIDYCLAQICALQFYNRILAGENVWDDYYNLCKVGGSMSFLELVKLGNLKSPFEEGCIKETLTNIVAQLDTYDVSKL